MNKNILIILGAVALVATGIYMFWSSSGTSDVASKIKSSLDPNKGIVCKQIVAQGDAGSSESTFYVYKDKIRYDSVIKHKDAGVKEMHLIQDNNKTYMWGSALAFPGAGNMGFVMNEGDEGLNIMQQADFEAIQKGNYNIPGLNCELWNPDEKMFILPNDIKFVSYQDFISNPAMMMGGFNMPGAQQGASNPMQGALAPAGMPGMSCDLCAQIPDANARKQCEDTCVQ